jgi:hypothetical protein
MKEKGAVQNSLAQPSFLFASSLPHGPPEAQHPPSSLPAWAAPQPTSPETQHPARSFPSLPLTATQARVSAPLSFSARTRLPFLLPPSDQRSPPVRLFFSLATLPCSLPRSLPAGLVHPSLGVAPPRYPLDPLLRTAPRLDASGSYPSSDEAQAATARGMRGTRWIGGPHAEAASPSLFLSVASSGRPKPPPKSPAHPSPVPPVSGSNLGRCRHATLAPPPQFALAVTASGPVTPA